MRLTKPAAWLARTAIPACLATATLSGQLATPQQAPQAPLPVFTKTVTYRAHSLIARDSKDRFVPNLTKDDFDLYEDGVLQRIDVFYPVIGGRAINAPTAAAPARPGGAMILPTRKVTQPDSSGRVFVILIDDMSVKPQDTPKLREVLKLIRDHLVQDNDLLGIVSSGYSGIATDLQYDYQHVRLDEAIHKAQGSGMTSDDIARANQTSQGPAGLRYQAHTAMKTARDVLLRAALLTDRRKAFIWVSAGYDFDPFRDARLKYAEELYGVGSGQVNAPSDPTKTVSDDPNADPFQNHNNAFADTDLVADEAELIRVANRSNMTIYTIDPRGQMAGPDIGSTTVVTSTEWSDYVHATTNSLIALGDNTGGFCICNSNDYLKGLDKINNDTSDYYMLGYNSTNQDPFKLLRKLEIKAKKPGLTLYYVNQYSLPRPKK